MAQPARAKVTFTEFLRREEASLTKNEWYDGEILENVAMAGGTMEHAYLINRVGAALSNALEGRPCRAFSSELLVRVQTTGLSTYPDASVVCGPIERDPESRRVLTNPTLLVEVLSPTSEAYDRGEKFAHYRQIPSLREYVLVSSAVNRVEVFRRNPDESWTLYASGAGETARLLSIDVVLTVDTLYAGIEEIRSVA